MGGLPKGGPKRGQRSGGRHAGRSGAGGRIPEEYFSIRHPDYRRAESKFVGLDWSYLPVSLDFDELDKLEERLRDDGEAGRKQGRRGPSRQPLGTTGRNPAAT
jgi:hypothetical protein